MPKRATQLNRRSFLAGMGALAGMAAAPSAVLALDSAKESYQQTALFMGTVVRIDIAGAPVSLAEDGAAKAFAEGRRLEAVLTCHDASSPLGVLNSQGSLADVPQELGAVMRQAADIHSLSQGRFDPTVLPLLSLLRSAREEGRRVDPKELAERLELVGFCRVRRFGGLGIESGMGVTLDGVAKGYIAQAMARVLAQTGLANYMVNAGGDIVASGHSCSGAPWRVAVEDPLRAGSYPCAVSLTDRSLATSGVYEQVLLDGSRSHLVIPASQAMADCVSASVAAPDCALADALATAFAVMEPAKAVQLADAIPGVGCLLLLRSGGSLASRGWSA